ncbi:proton-conducting transporter membrane subunit [Geodermatophilus sp. YIM 151500]|uniref:NADH-quinone oxidoreductase subunit N n=1 Tax=Geodermatophilus sp. YIM 151500 TaxID=2984531 RepID=UPI0021E3BAFD|nr:proton-conducting transporter membrane subunit [Geodermatophilus sp. YIM 151500]MCV2488420.1 proton-conducting transporter membrane subunit [Geodermatophilus sp. YIM 151500]
MQLAALLPEACLVVGAVAALLAGSFLPRTRQWGARLIAVTALVASGAATLVVLGDPARTVMMSAFAVDTATNVVRLVVVAGTLLVIGLGVDELAGQQRESETYALLLLSALGASVLGGSNDLLVLAVAFLLTSIPLYALIGIRRDAGAAEAALKTYLLGALFGILLLLGLTVLYGVGGATAYAALADGLRTAPAAATAAGAVGVVAGLMFKAGGVPGHFWVPDAAQAAGTAAAGFLTTIPKVGALVAVYRLVVGLPDTVAWSLLVAVIAAVTMTLGNLAALAQRDVRRLLGWSTVSQVGYLLLPVAVAGRTDSALPSLLLYLAGYAVTNLAAFAVVAAVPERRTVDDHRGLAATSPWLAAALVVSLLSLVGTPPTAVFLGKLTVFTAAWDGGLAWLVVVAAANTVVSLFYYLRWIGPAFRAAGGAPQDGQRRPYALVAAVLAAACVLALGLAAGAVSPVVEGPVAR